MIPQEYMNTIVCGDARELSKQIPDGSIDLIFTDPPYLKEYLYLYDWLAVNAARVLKPTGFMLVYTPSVWKDYIMASMRQHVTYFSDCVVLATGPASVIWHTKTLAKAKFILVYKQNGSKALPRVMFHNMIKGEGREKDNHEWQQGMMEAGYYIDCFSAEEQIVYDPFMGGGTTAAVCAGLNRNFVGFEIDKAHAFNSNLRVKNVERN